MGVGTRARLHEDEDGERDGHEAVAVRQAAERVVVGELADDEAGAGGPDERRVEEDGAVRGTEPAPSVTGSDRLSGAAEFLGDGRDEAVVVTTTTPR